MIPALHRSLQKLIYERGNIDQREVEIMWEAPTRERIGRMTQPALCLFLYDIQENLDLRQSTVETSRANGRVRHRLASRRFDLHYLVSSLTTNVDDEHLLLWRVLTTLVRYPQIPPGLMEEDLQTLDPLPVGHICHENDVQKQFSVWNALGMQPHPAFCYVVTVPIELDLMGDTPLVLRRTARYSTIQTASEIHEVRHQIGGVVRDRQGAPLAGVSVAPVGSTRESITNGEGIFVLHDVPVGTLQLRVSHGKAEAQMFAINIPETLADGNATSQLSYSLIIESAPASEGPSV